MRAKVIDWEYMSRKALTMKKVYTIVFLLLIGLMLYRPEICLAFSLRGLQLWFEKMVPALFPFMILSGVIIRMNLTEELVSFCAPVLQRIFRTNRSVIYGILIGFLCGFPMGAKVAAQLYETRKISQKEAEYLLCFCNNIGPIYFLSFVLPTIGMNTLGISQILLSILGMYGLPLCYGLLLRYTLYRNSISYKDNATISLWHEKNQSILQHSDAPKNSEQVTELTAASQMDIGSKLNLLQALDSAIQDGIHSIVMLGGYMIVFNALNLVPYTLLGENYQVISPLLEITGGIGTLGNTNPLLVLCLLPMGGFSCIAQTYTIIRNTPLKIGKYIMNKVVLTMITIPYYLWIL